MKVRRETARLPVTAVYPRLQQKLHESSGLRASSNINRSTTANDPRPSASFSARKNPQRIPANTLPVFSGLRPPTWTHLLRLVTKVMSDRLLAQMAYAGTPPEGVIGLTLFPPL